jgi:L-serine dehydratase
MKYNSAFEIIGPIMVGPSSSHTAGAVRIGNLARQLLTEEPETAVFELMGSFAETYRGHGTDLALLAGVLGYTTEDSQVAQADTLAELKGLVYTYKVGNLGFYHPNTVAVELKGATRAIHIVASSLGGGKAEVQEVDGMPLRFTGEKPTLILSHVDKRGFLAGLTHVLDEAGYNIARVALERWNRGGHAMTVCEVDEEIGSDMPSRLSKALPQLSEVRIVQTE